MLLPSQMHATGYTVSIIPIRAHVLAPTPARSILSQTHAESYTRHRAGSVRRIRRESDQSLTPLNPCSCSYRRHKQTDTRHRECVTRSTTCDSRHSVFVRSISIVLRLHGIDRRYHIVITVIVGAGWPSLRFTNSPRRLYVL